MPNIFGDSTLDEIIRQRQAQYSSNINSLMQTNMNRASTGAEKAGVGVGSFLGALGAKYFGTPYEETAQGKAIAQREAELSRIMGKDFSTRSVDITTEDGGITTEEIPRSRPQALEAQADAWADFASKHGYSEAYKRSLDLRDQAATARDKQSSAVREESKNLALSNLMADPTDTNSAQLAVTLGANPADVQKLRGTQLKSLSKFGKIAEDLGFVAGTPQYQSKVQELLRTNPDGTKIIQEADVVPSAFVTAFGKEEAKRMVEQGADARTAVTSLTALSDSVDLINNNALITGTAANFRLGFTKLLSEAGFIAPDADVAATEAFFKNQGNQVAQVIKAFGAGTGLSDADREYAKGIAAGEETLTRDALVKLVNLQRKYQMMGIERYNKELSAIDSDEIRAIAKPLEIPKVPMALPANARRGKADDGTIVYEIDGKIVDIYGKPVG